MRPTTRLLALLLVLALGSCATQPPPPQVVIHEDTVVLDAAAREQLTEYHEDGTMVFVAGEGVNLPDFQAGDLLVSEPAGSAAPYGLLRRVTGVDSSVAGQLTVTTEQATMMDILEKGSLHEQFELTEDDIESVEPLTEGLTFTMMDQARLAELLAGGPAAGLSPQQFGSFGFDFEVIIFDTDGNEQTKNDQMVGFGGITFKPSAKIDLDVSCSYWCFGGIDVDFMSELSMNETAKLGIKGKGPLGLNLQKTIPLVTFNMNPITFFIGPVPVVITPKLKVELKFEGGVGASVSYEVNQSLTVKVGVQYDDGWDTTAEFDNDFSVGPVKADEPVSAVLVAKAKGAARAELMFYGVLGPTFELAPYLKIDLKYPRDPIWKLDAGIEANLGVHIDVLGWDKSFQTNLIDNSVEIARAGNSQPVLDFQNSPNSQTLIASGLLLRSLVADPEEGSPCCTVSYRSSNTADGSGGNLGTGAGFGHELAVSFSSLGTRTITARAVDSKGAASEKSISLTVVNENPLLFITSPFNGQEFFEGQPVKLRGSSYDASEPGFALDCATQMVWTSDQPADALPVVGCTATVSFASTGERLLTLTGADSHGGEGQLSVALVVVEAPDNLPPVVNITSPADNLQIGPDALLTLTGTAVDPEGAAIVAITWDVLTGYNPATGTGVNLLPVVLDGNNQWRPTNSINYSGGCEVNDTLRLRRTAQDADGQSGADFVVLRVIRVC